MTVYNRTLSKCEPLVQMGASIAKSPLEVAENSGKPHTLSSLPSLPPCNSFHQLTDIIFSIVGYPKDVEETILGDEGVLSGCSKGNTIVEMTTSEPSLARRISEIALREGVESLDAPVSGGDVGAKNATLSFMVYTCLSLSLSLSRKTKQNAKGGRK